MTIKEMINFLQENNERQEELVKGLEGKERDEGVQEEIDLRKLWVEIDNTCVEALEKQVPKKGKLPGGSLTICPTCGKGISIIAGREATLKYCWNCGQRIDWSEDDDD